MSANDNFAYELVRMVAYRRWLHPPSTRSASATSRSTRRSPTAKPELAELTADVLNGQNVVIFAPRRYGKSSLVWRAAQQLAAKRVLVAQVDLMTVADEGAAGREARPVDLRGDRHTALPRARARGADLSKPADRARDDARPDGRHRSGSASEPGTRPRTSTRRSRSSSSFRPSSRRSESRRVCIVFDEFQEVARARPEPAGADARRLPDAARGRARLSRQQAEHDGGLFNDANEPFWRSAKQLELGVIAAGALRAVHPRSDSRGRTSGSRRPASQACSRSHVATRTRRRSSAMRSGRRRRPRKGGRGRGRGARSSASCARSTRISR